MEQKISVEIKNQKIVGFAGNNGTTTYLSDYCKTAKVGGWEIKIITDGEEGRIKVSHHKPGKYCIATKRPYSASLDASSGILHLMEYDNYVEAYAFGSKFHEFIYSHFGIDEYVFDTAEQQRGLKWSSGLSDVDRRVFFLVSDGGIKYTLDDGMELDDLDIEIMNGYNGRVRYEVTDASWLIIFRYISTEDQHQIRVKIITDVPDPCTLVPELEAALERLEISSFRDCLEFVSL